MALSLMTHETPGSTVHDTSCTCDRYRTARLLHTVALRLRKHTQRKGAFQAWNRCLGHLLALAKAHIESVIYTRLSAGVSACSDPDARKSLKVGCVKAGCAHRGRSLLVSAPWPCPALAAVLETCCQHWPSGLQAQGCTVAVWAVGAELPSSTLSQAHSCWGMPQTACLVCRPWRTSSPWAAYSLMSCSAMTTTLQPRRWATWLIPCMAPLPLRQMAWMGMH